MTVGASSHDGLKFSKANQIGSKTKTERDDSRHTKGESKRDEKKRETLKHGRERKACLATCLVREKFRCRCGCGRPKSRADIKQLQGHEIIFRSEGGSDTDTKNVVMLYFEHQRELHQEAGPKKLRIIPQTKKGADGKLRWRQGKRTWTT